MNRLGRFGGILLVGHDTGIEAQLLDIRRLGEEMHSIAGRRLVIVLDGDGVQPRKGGLGDLAEEIDQSGRGVEADRVAVEDLDCFGAEFLVDGEEADAGLETLGVGLCEDFLVGGPLAVEDDVGADEALGGEVEVVDSVADFFGEFFEFEGFWGADDDGLAAFELALGEGDLCEC